MFVQRHGGGGVGELFSLEIRGGEGEKDASLHANLRARTSAGWSFWKTE